MSQTNCPNLTFKNTPIYYYFAMSNSVFKFLTTNRVSYDDLKLILGSSNFTFNFNVPNHLKTTAVFFFFKLFVNYSLLREGTRGTHTSISKKKEAEIILVQTMSQMQRYGFLSDGPRLESPLWFL